MGFKSYKNCQKQVVVFWTTKYHFSLLDSYELSWIWGKILKKTVLNSMDWIGEFRFILFLKMQLKAQNRLKQT